MKQIILILTIIILLGSIIQAEEVSYFTSDEYKRVSTVQIGELISVSGDGTYIMSPNGMNSDPKAKTKIFCNDGLMTQKTGDKFVIKNINTGETYTIEYPNSLPINQIQQSAFFDMGLGNREKYKDFICVEGKNKKSWLPFGKKKTEEKTEECLEDEILVDGECEYRCEFDENWENNKCVPDIPLGPNQYKSIEYDGKKIIKFMDAFGKEQYTIDGKHYYDSAVKATNTGVMRKGWNFVKETPGDVWDFFFKTKLKDKSKQLQRDIATEVLSDFKYEDDKKREKSYEKMTEKLGEATDEMIEGALGKSLPWPMGDLIGLPGESIKQFSQEATSTEFSQATMIYIQEREDKKSARQVYDAPPEELQMAGGGFKGISSEIMTKAPKALLFSKFEESYQKYLIAKELGRK